MNLSRKIVEIMKLFLILSAIVALACSSGKTVLKEYPYVKDKVAVVDSIEASGTRVGQEKMAVFTLDDGKRDTIYIAPLYRGKEAVGTLQVRTKADGYNLIIIDVE